MSSSNPEIRMIEFFSGIGGMRLGVELALDSIQNNIVLDNSHPHEEDIDELTAQSSSIAIATTTTTTTRRRSPFHSCVAYEISLHANQTYRHNFHSSHSSSSSSSSNNLFHVTTKLVEQLKPQDLDGKANLWTLSPPCQPFTTTRNAKQLDASDNRCQGLKGLMVLLRRIVDRPKWILLENVKGFIGSDLLTLWYECLEECGYSWKEYLLTPVQFGIPNHRKRYYMMCELSDRFKRESQQKDDNQPLSRSSHTNYNSEGNIPSFINTHISNNHEQNYESKTISSYIYNLDQEELSQYLIPNDVYSKSWAKDLPIVSPHDTISHCFTAAYGRQLHKATGSLLLVDPNRQTSLVESPLDRSNMTMFQNKLRRFTPDELLKIFGFPDYFEFPLEIPLNHRYKLIGNSVNVSVVAKVASELLIDSSC